jgi:hypothetical protein
MEVPAITTRSVAIFEQLQYCYRATADCSGSGFQLSVENRIAKNYHQTVVVDVEVMGVQGGTIAVTLACAYVCGDPHRGSFQVGHLPTISISRLWPGRTGVC